MNARLNVNLISSAGRNPTIERKYNRELAERSNAAVLKTVDCNRSGGSNPSLSAKGADNQIVVVFTPVTQPILRELGTKKSPA